MIFSGTGLSGLLCSERDELCLPGDKTLDCFGQTGQPDNVDPLLRLESISMRTQLLFSLKGLI